MKNRTWMLLIGVVLVLCIVLSCLLLTGKTAPEAEVWSEGAWKCTLNLKEDQTIVVESANGRNEITVKDGKVAVTAADCPDHCCMERGYCDGGAPIVCLPNQLVIRFPGEQTVDGVAG